MTFEAKYHGRCGVCDERIDPGDPCAYAEDVIVHGDCEQAAARAERRKRPVCEKCWTEVTPAGTCGCDE